MSDWWWGRGGRFRRAGQIGTTSTASRMRPVRVAAVSMVSQFGDVPANTRRIVELLRTTAAAGAHWAVFPELCLQGAHTDNDRMELEAEPYKGGAAIAAIAAACRANSVACSVGMVLRVSPTRKFNAVVHITGDGNVVGYAPKVQMGPGEVCMCNSPTPEEAWVPVDLGFAKVGALSEF